MQSDGTGAPAGTLTSASMPPSAIVVLEEIVNTVGLSFALAHSDRRMARITATAGSEVSPVIDAIGTLKILFIAPGPGIVRSNCVVF